MGDIIGNTQNFLAATTTLTAGGDDDDDNDDPSANFDLANPVTLLVNVNTDLAAAQSVTAIQATGSQDGRGVWGTGGKGVLGETADVAASLVETQVVGPCGVRGNSVMGDGVVGASSQGHGVHGDALSTNHSGVFGRGSVGVWGDGRPPDPKLPPQRQIGVLGTTDGIELALDVQGSDEAVRGYSVAGFALRGITEKNYAGVFETGVKINKVKQGFVQVAVPAHTAQVRLVPATITKHNPSAGLNPNGQQFPGLGGDLLVLKADNGDATLWFCFRDGVNWKQIA